MSEGQSIVLPVVIRTGFKSQYDGSAIVAYLTKLDGRFATIVFGDGSVYDSFTSAAKTANTRYLHNKDYNINGHHAWCVKVYGDNVLRIKHLKDRLVSSETNVEMSSFDLYCRHSYKIGDRQPAKALLSPKSCDDLEYLVMNLDEEKAKRLWTLRHLPVLHSVGAIYGTDQLCTISWNGNTLTNVEMPRMMLEQHPKYAELARRPKQTKLPSSSNLIGQVASYEDRILDGDYFQITGVIKDGESWTLKIRGDYNEIANVTLPKGVVEGLSQYYGWYQHHMTVN